MSARSLTYLSGPNLIGSSVENQHIKEKWKRTKQKLRRNSHPRYRSITLRQRRQDHNTRIVSTRHPTMMMTKSVAPRRRKNLLPTRQLDQWVVRFVVLCLLSFFTTTGESFVVPPASSSWMSRPWSPPVGLYKLAAVGATTAYGDPRGGRDDNDGGPREGKGSTSKARKKGKRVTIGELKQQIIKNPSKLDSLLNGNNGQSKTKTKRTRKRVENAKQTYLYKAQRIKLQKQESGDPDVGVSDGESEGDTHEHSNNNNNTAVVLAEARRFGLTNPAGQHCDPLVDDVVPEIVGRILVAIDEGSDDETKTSASPSSYAYIINKPSGWSIVGGKGISGNNGPATKSTNAESDYESTIEKKKAGKNARRRVKIINDDGNEEYLEFDETEILELLSPEERTKLEEGSFSMFGPSVGPAYDNVIADIPGWYDVASMSREEREEAGIDDDDYDPKDIVPFDEAKVAELLAAEQEHEQKEPKVRTNQQSDTGAVISSDDPSLPESVRENLKRIEARAELRKKRVASFASTQRPSVVSWLKESFASEGVSIRGGNYWTARCGAVDVDDSGLVLLCPKKCGDNLFVDYTEYAVVVGNGNYLAQKSKNKSSTKEVPKESLSLDLMSKVKKGRDGDVIQTVRVGISEGLSTCSSIVQPVQRQFDDGIRGDPSANPFDRRAPRRLIHCSSMTVSSMVVDESTNVDADLPDDIKIFSDRLNNHKYQNGSFLGRQALRENPLTNAYREINGAADGFPGWTVDRYGEWLFIQHDEKEYRGPLPSIHDGNTAGVYILPAFADRGAMGSRDNVRPRLMEGRPAPSSVSIVENGVTYLVSLDKDLSTGIFLDQRPQRAWLTRNCNKETHVLNCFAHCGAFSVAAATAGASTVSLDLNKKWLDRIPPQLDANGIPFDERHDCIYGDVFEWLEKLAKRGEKYDIVILDPPSSSVGTKKRRWSVKNDFDELVQLAAPLVKTGGLLWTTTNSASVSPLRFASLCQKGFDDAGITSAKLERIQPSPLDFPSIGPQSVKNLVWRIG